MGIPSSKKNSAKVGTSSLGGGFRTFGLLRAIYLSIDKIGYRQPTPIQRKAIPILLKEHDLVAMARTGSGKTAAFVIPLVQRLQEHSSVVGARALILSPSRELAMQTLKVCKRLTVGTNLRLAAIVGGDSVDDNFMGFASNPDIIIATPGRLLHVLIEMGKELKTIKMLILDEADRLLELGFLPQLTEIFNRLPKKEHRQTALFSATLPKALIQFGRLGMKSDAQVVRLDSDIKLSDTLKLYFFLLNTERKEAMLLYLLRNHHILLNGPTMVFTSTKHHVEYLHLLLEQSGISVTSIHGSMAQEARSERMASFSRGRVAVMVVSDLAARGLDIPILANVVHYHFPAAPKLFVHRSGRVGRAGRIGASFAFLNSEELGHALDLQLFLNRPLHVSGREPISETEAENHAISAVSIGLVPLEQLEEDAALVSRLVKDDSELERLKKQSINGYRLYWKTSLSPSPESYKRAKAIYERIVSNSGLHHIFRSKDAGMVKRAELIAELNTFRPPLTVLQWSNKNERSKGIQHNLLGKRRAVKQALDEINAQEAKRSKRVLEDYDLDMTGTFKRAKTAKGYQDETHYVPYEQRDRVAEKGYSILGADARVGTKGVSLAEVTGAKAALELMPDDNEIISRQLKSKPSFYWNKAKQKFTRVGTVGGNNKKLIRTEGGVRLPMSYKSGRYKQWKQKTRVIIPNAGEKEHKESSAFNAALRSKRRGRVVNYRKRQGLPSLPRPKVPQRVKEERRRAEHKLAVQTKSARQLLNPQQILKERKTRAMKRLQQKKGRFRNK